ncbi:MAG: M20/M25/M40 family metallo-hydrolase [Lachnospiraceae bacterium]|nr:M20/M25/M40 family metallo-hydrolase [Lachnospiraceae bacterium]
MAHNLAAAFVEENHSETLELLKTLTAIPAPTGMEEKRAAFILDWLKKEGADSAYIDSVGNVVFPYPAADLEKYAVVMAHMDTVFPETDPIEVKEDILNLYAPGIGDDTGNLVNMLMTIRFFLRHPEIQVDTPVLFVADVCEEGFGNLKGCRQIFSDYEGRIKSFISFDLYLDTIVERAVGSKRFRVEARTKGGHSLQNFGNKSAIKVLSDLIQKLYDVKLPIIGKTVYNVGTISGGTSVNSIPECAELTYEIRSDMPDNLEYMEKYFISCVEKLRFFDVSVEIELLGERPCGIENESAEAKYFCNTFEYILSRSAQEQIHIMSGSTDANIPLSLGIPAVTFGTVMGGGIHTQKEWISKESMKTGQLTAIVAVSRFFDVPEPVITGA